jgi:hypothetical protein
MFGGGGACTKMNFYFTLVFVPPQEFQNFITLWIPACILNVSDR